ncbi:hypothetical protein BKH42_00300 [Helicobacter sp. 13S00482-2]|uniref:GGDEF domain-containing protein n=1 Tax=Helicobacter sp. 13S00482-2 TaxID=1476200 RepID=UPI000BA4E8D3|nr:diguanylate cyclase [Helicobacter sp. 13S00482-2]PAF54395.1 hypothetical protein BKH42_00300 [Helicobacter sp. 13S00482-2]
MGNKEEEISDFGSNIFFGKLDPEIPNPDKNDEFILEDQVAGKISTVAQNTVKKLEEEGLPAFPANYQLYFERLLEQEETSFKQKIQSVMDLQSMGEDRAVAFEKSVKEGFKNIKQILDFIAVLYKNLQLVQSVTEKHMKSMEKIDNKIVLSNAISVFLKDIDKVNDVTSAQLNQIKELYQKTAQVISDINKNTIYDSRFGIYNKRYFMTLLEKENKLMEEFTHSSSILTMQLTKDIQDSIQDKSTLMVLLKNIAKLLLKTSRRSDIIGYIGDGVFGIGLKYSDIPSATKAAERFVHSVKTTNIFLGERDISLNVSVGIAKIIPERTAEDSLEAALSALQVALKEGLELNIYAQDQS